MPRRANKNKNKKKSSSNSGLGKAIKNKYGGKPERENRAQGRVKRKDHIIDQQFANHTNNNLNDNKLKSITEVSNIQEFVDTMHAEQKQRDLERQENEEMKLITVNPQESVENIEKSYHRELDKTESFNYENLPIPRKPSWDGDTTKEELLRMENEVFLNWRRGLAVTAKQTNLEMTPFEKNIEVWKQLWRVIERANLLILIVDARNPLAFISRDLFNYVYECSQIRNQEKKCILMMNKADYLTPLQRKYWRQYFQDQLNIQIIYFSAIREQIRLDILSKSHREIMSDEQTKKIMNNIDIDHKSKNEHGNEQDVVNVDRLISIFDEIRDEMDLSDKIEIGMIGYPNVGKSSVINVLMGAKKVSIGSTPGKTKHFQTLNLTEKITLCDCPGLVFPTLMNSKSDLILNGVIPIDNLTDFITPSRLMIHRLSIKQINQCYNLRIPTNKKQIKFITVYDILDAYCHQKKMYNKSKVPNRNEAARIMLKDYIKGKLVYNHYPPHLNSRHKFLFYHGKMLENQQKIDNKDEPQNVLDQSKLNGINGNNIDNEDEEEEEEEEELNNNVGMTDEEFLNLWKHPMEDYGGSLMGGSKKKHDKKARVMRRIEKRTQKQNRKYRRDADNFAAGSNAVVVSAVPQIKPKNKPVLL